jgi:hypothetical protein
MEALELEGWPADRTLTLAGAPRDLRLPVSLTNGSPSAVAIADASLAEVTLGEGGPPLRLEPVPVGLVVAANGALAASIRLRLDRATPPGRYTGKVSLAGLSRPVEIDVAPDAALTVTPAPVVVDAALGRSPRVAASFANRGNVALTLDLTGRYRLGEELALGTHPLPTPGEGLEKLRQLLELVPGLARRPALVDVGEAALTMPGGPTHLAPGAVAIVEIDVALPEGLSPTARYHLFAPVYAADLHIVVVTAAKPGRPARGRRTRGT